METDFDENGEIKPDARATRVPCNAEYFHKRINFEPDSYAELKAFVLKHKELCEKK